MINGTICSYYSFFQQHTYLQLFRQYYSKCWGRKATSVGRTLSPLYFLTHGLCFWLLFLKLTKACTKCCELFWGGIKFSTRFQSFHCFWNDPFNWTPGIDLQSIARAFHPRWSKRFSAFCMHTPKKLASIELCESWIWRKMQLCTARRHCHSYSPYLYLWEQNIVFSVHQQKFDF